MVSRPRIIFWAVCLVSVIALLGACTASASWVQKAKLTNEGCKSGIDCHFGVWTAIEGNTAVVTAPDNLGPHGGLVDVFHRDSTGHWGIESVLKASSGPETASFGQSAGLLGNTIVVGDWGAECAVVFQRSASGGWSQSAVLRPSDGVPGNSFGFSVSISTSGILVGDWSHDRYRGAAYFFSNSNGIWRQTSELIPPAAPQGLTFGLSVALDGSTAAIGAPFLEGERGPGEGFVYQQSSGGGWSEVGQLRLEGGGMPGDLLGRSVAVTGREVAMGATGGTFDQERGTPGAAYMFAPTIHGYSDGRSLLSTKPKGFGYSVAASGSELLVGAVAQEEGRGAVYAFHGNGKGEWSLQQELTSNVRTVGGRFGNGVALDGTNLLIGADEAGEAGAAYVFGKSA